MGIKQKCGLKKIWGMFTIFIALFVINCFIKTDISATSIIWLTLSFCVTILAVVMLARNKLPNKKQIVISLVFGLLMFVAYRELSFSSIETCIVTFLCSMASFSIFNKYETNAINLLKRRTLKSILGSITIGILVGTIFGVINIFLSGGEPTIKITLSCFLTALSPAIYEEIAFRLFLYSVCLYFLDGQISSNKEKLTCWFMMIIPHVMIHTPEIFITGDIISAMINIILLSLLFGLPFAVLQRKRDLTSAMIAHGIVDVIRFCIFGVPI